MRPLHHVLRRGAFDEDDGEGLRRAEMDSVAKVDLEPIGRVGQHPECASICAHAEDPGMRVVEALGLLIVVGRRRPILFDAERLIGPALGDEAIAEEGAGDFAGAVEAGAGVGGDGGREGVTAVFEARDDSPGVGHGAERGQRAWEREGARERRRVDAWGDEARHAIGNEPRILMRRHGHGTDDSATAPPLTKSATHLRPHSELWLVAPGAEA